MLLKAQMLTGKSS